MQVTGLFSNKIPHSRFACIAWVFRLACFCCCWSFSAWKVTAWRCCGCPAFATCLSVEAQNQDQTAFSDEPWPVSCTWNAIKRQLVIVEWPFSRLFVHLTTITVGLREKNINSPLFGLSSLLLSTLTKILFILFSDLLLFGNKVNIPQPWFKWHPRTRRWLNPSLEIINAVIVVWRIHNGPVLVSEMSFASIAVVFIGTATKTKEHIDDLLFMTAHTTFHRYIVSLILLSTTMS